MSNENAKSSTKFPVVDEMSVIRLKGWVRLKSNVAKFSDYDEK